MAEEAGKYKKAILAGGCFWCMESPFEKIDGVISVTSGYTGGAETNPTYKEVSYGQTGHAEAVEVVYDPSKVAYKTILDVFWRNIKPTQSDGQFADIGSQYRTEIFYTDEEQKEIAEESKDEYNNKGIYDGPIVTKITPASTFYPAEEYHQDYYKKHPLQYKMYKHGSGRAGYIKDVWGNEK